MRVPEISLVNGLHAQNKHDLCRTISIQNDIDKLNTFQLTQFHLWWCQVCRAWEFSYRGTDNQLFVFEAAIDLLSFIQLFPKDWKKRSYLSLGGVSSVALMTFLSERPQITSVFLCLDNDQAGNEACEKLAGEISEGYSVIRLKPSRKDWNEILCDKNADRKKAIAETITIKVPETEELVPDVVL
mgnify:FL=1